MILLDSNIFIYAALPEQAMLRERLLEQSVSASAISRIEVFGYHRLTRKHEQHLEKMFNAVDVIPITDAVVAMAIRLRQQRRMSLGDAIVAATALEYGMAIWTHNVKDFAWVEGLIVYDPFNNISADGESPDQSTETE